MNGKRVVSLLLALLLLATPALAADSLTLREDWRLTSDLPLENDGALTIGGTGFFIYELGGRLLPGEGAVTFADGVVLYPAAGDVDAARIDPDGVWDTAESDALMVLRAGGYAVTCADASNGTVTADRLAAAAGETVRLTAAPEPGYRLESLSATAGGSAVTVSDGAFVMPNGDVTVTASFVAASGSPGGGGGGVVSGYRVTVSGAEHGTVQVNPRNAKEGDTVTITVTPDEGYVLDSLTVTASDGTAVRVRSIGGDQYTFTMPDGRVTVEAEFAEYVAPLPFDDVAANDWFSEAVRFVYENGLMNGTGSGRFSPDATTTRGMIVTILYRLIGEPAAGAGSFSDVTSGAYYADAIAWAAANDIVNGYTDGTFRPDAPITREQMAAILYRYSQYCGYAVGTTADLSGYADASQVSGYAAEAMGWANGAGLITGVTTTTLNPAGSATRAQVATILMRYIQTVAE